MKKLLFSLLILTSQFSFGQATDSGIMHISFDDGQGIFRNLNDSIDVYTSAFDNPFLGELKRLHDKYGAVFSIYIFLTYDNWKFDQTTTKFAAEFTENADWLKFNVHQGLTTANYASADRATTVSDYEYFLTHLQNIMGNDSASIDLMPRLHNFAGSEASCLAFQEYGLLGFLGADDSRDSYYLKGENTKTVYNGDYFYDPSNDLYIFRSELRLEKVSNVNTFLSDFKTKANLAKQAQNLIIFTHEYECYEYPANKLDMSIFSKVETCCSFAQQNGYRFDFPQFIVRDTFLIEGYVDTTATFLVNPSFEGGAYQNGQNLDVPDSWTLEAAITSPSSNLSDINSRHGAKHFEVGGDGIASIDLYQNLTLPKGDYVAKAYLNASSPEMVEVYAHIGDSSYMEPAKFANKWRPVAVNFEILEDSANVKVGVQATSSVRIDDFQLYRKIEEVVIPEDTTTQDSVQVITSGFAQNNVNIFPNPAMNYLHIQIPESMSDCEVQVYNINGQLLMKNQIASLDYMLDISGIDEGLFLVKLVKGERIINQRFVKEK